MQRLLLVALVAFLAAAAPTESSFLSAAACGNRNNNRPTSTTFVVVTSNLKDASSSRRRRSTTSSSSSSSTSQINESSSSSSSNNRNEPSAGDRRSFLTTTTTSAAAFVAATTTAFGYNTGGTPKAHALGPVKLNLIPTKITAVPCPPSKPIPGEKAMKGMRGLCVTVQADLQDPPPKELIKVGVYGFVTDGETGDSVLANNPDLSTDAGQFAMIELVNPNDKSVVFEFVAAVPVEKDLRGYDNGIGPLNFESLRLISYPGGQQFGAISPCEMNEFSDECAEWEQENGPYKKAEFMVKSNARTMGR